MLVPSTRNPSGNDPEISLNVSEGKVFATGNGMFTTTRSWNDPWSNEVVLPSNRVFALSSTRLPVSPDIPGNVYPDDCVQILSILLELSEV